MTIPEAAQLVIQAGALAKGGDVFLLDMGEPIKIVDLAFKMIQLSGLDIRDELHPEGDIEVQEIGLRPGEKLYEELLIDGDPEKTQHPRIFKSREAYLPWDKLETYLNLIQKNMDSDDRDALIATLQEIVDGYVPSSMFSAPN